jgi:hypothetical protein
MYFGQLKPVVAAMSQRVDPGLSRDTIENNASRCVETVVFSRLDGATGVVYAEQLGRGWGAVEYPPSKQVSGDRAVRQQLVVPPDGAAKGQSWTARAALEQDGAISDRSSYFTLQLTDTQGSQLSWLVNRSDAVSCSA